MAKPVEVIEVYQTESSSEADCMERWNELIAGFVLGNLTPEEAKSIAQILAENPQLASHVARLRNTATVRSLGKTEWSTARSQDGSEGWADTALDRPLYDRDDYGQEVRLFGSSGLHPSDLKMLEGRAMGAIAPEEKGLEKPVEEDRTQILPLLASPATPIYRHPYKRKAFRIPRPTFERFSLIEALLVPAFNPLWWIVIVAAVSMGIDNFRVRRSHQSTLEELTELKAMPQPDSDNRPQ